MAPAKYTELEARDFVGEEAVMERTEVQRPWLKRG